MIFLYVRVQQTFVLSCVFGVDVQHDLARGYFQVWAFFCGTAVEAQSGTADAMSRPIALGDTPALSAMPSNVRWRTDQPTRGLPLGRSAREGRPNQLHATNGGVPVGRPKRLPGGGPTVRWRTQLQRLLSHNCHFWFPVQSPTTFACLLHALLLLLCPLGRLLSEGCVFLSLFATLSHFV